MTVNVEDLKKQLASAEAEFEHVKAQLYRLDGVIQVLKALIMEAEKPSDKKKKDVVPKGD